MFERFTKDARAAVVGAQAEARALGHPFIGPEHLLLALLDGEDPVARALGEHGVTVAGIRAWIGRGSEDPLDSEALRTIGIDLDAVREATEGSFGAGALDVPAGRLRRVPKGHIPFTRKAKKSLELSLRHALRLGSKEIGSGHVLLGVLHDEDFVSTLVVSRLGVDVGALRADITRLLRAEAA